MTSETSNPLASDTAPEPQVVGRPLVSLALFIHLFCVLVALSGSLFRSGLQERLLGLFAPYTQLLGFDPAPAAFYLTHGLPNDFGQSVEVLPEGQDATDNANWLALEDRGARGGERLGRTQRLASLLGFFAGRLETAARDRRPDEDANVAINLLARSVAEHLLYQEHVTPKQLRCRRHLVQEIDALSGTAEQRDPFSESYYQQFYRANTIVMDQGQVEILRPIDEARDVAPPDGKKTPPLGKTP